MTRAPRRVSLLTIAGSDPTAGAGIEADLLTFARHGEHGVAVITALTTQDSRAVRRIGATDPKEFEIRLRTLLSDVRPRAWKIGLLPSSSHVRTVSRAIDDFAPEIVVLDPIVAASSGTRFLDADGIRTMRSMLLGRVTVVTPNLEEAAALLSVRRSTIDRSPESAARRLLAFGSGAVLLKGGHRQGRDSVDLLVSATGSKTLAARRRSGTRSDVHGTGCALSAALLAALATGRSIETAANAAKRYITRAIDGSVAIGRGRRRLALVVRRNSRPDR